MSWFGRKKPALVSMDRYGLAEDIGQAIDVLQDVSERIISVRVACDRCNFHRNEAVKTDRVIKEQQETIDSLDAILTNRLMRGAGEEARPFTRGDASAGTSDSWWEAQKDAGKGFPSDKDVDEFYKRDRSKD